MGALMTLKRRWSEFPIRFKDQLDSTATIASVGGIGLGAAGWGVLAPPFTLILVGIGAAITFGTLGYSALKAVPPKLIDAHELLGKVLPLSDLDRLSVKIPSVSIIGPSRAGKTTLRNRLSFIRYPTERTNSLSAQIVSLPVAPTQYVALLDGGGHIYQHQFELAETCDHLCIVMDHNSSDTAKEPDNSRIGKHSDFLEQVSNSIREYRKSKLKSILFLWNKHDLWGLADEDSLKEFDEFRTKTVAEWKNANYARKIFDTAHSNEIPDDVAQVVEHFIKATAQSGDHQ